MSPSIPPCFYRVSTKALILDTDGQFLLCKENNGIYDFPGGGLDYGETPQKCIHRELMEEMGLTCTDVDDYPCYFLTFTNLKGNPSCANVFYKTSVENLNFIPSDECMEIGFFTPEEVKNLNVYPNVQEFLKIYKIENHVHH